MLTTNKIGIGQIYEYTDKPNQFYSKFLILSPHKIEDFWIIFIIEFKISDVIKNKISFEHYNTIQRSRLIC